MTTLTDPLTLHEDGYRVELVHSNGLVGLELVLYESGDASKRVRIAQFPRTNDNIADVSRLRSLVAALCAYKNAGGSSDELKLIAKVMVHPELPDLQVSDIIGTLLYVDESVERVVYYQCDDGRIIAVVVDDCIENVEDDAFVTIMERYGWRN